MKIFRITIEKYFSTRKNIIFRRIIKKEFSVEGGVRAVRVCGSWARMVAGTGVECGGEGRGKCRLRGGREGVLLRRWKQMTVVVCHGRVVLCVV